MSNNHISGFFCLFFGPIFAFSLKGFDSYFGLVGRVHKIPFTESPQTKATKARVSKWPDLDLGCYCRAKRVALPLIMSLYHAPDRRIRPRP